MLGRNLFEISISVPLVLEYEEAAKRISREVGLTHRDIDDLLDYLCGVGDRRQVFFLWRPFLKDPGDEMVLELAVEAGCDYVVTYNVRDFAGAERFGVRVVKPQEFLRLIGDIV